MKAIEIEYLENQKISIKHYLTYSLRDVEEVGIFSGGDEKGKCSTRIEFSFNSIKYFEQSKKNLERLAKSISAEIDFQPPKNPNILSPKDIEEGEGGKWGYDLTVDSQYKILH